jgi:hypothetical protein
VLHGAAPHPWYSRYFFGKKSKRKACAGIALAVDADSGIVHVPAVTDTSVAAGDAVAKVLLNAIQANRTLPKEVRVRSLRLRDRLVPLVGSFGMAIKIAPRLPALEHARTLLLRFFDRGIDGR